MRVDVLDILALIIGIFYTVRRLDIRKREGKDYPHVPKDAFVAWQRAEAGAYALASSACFAKVVIDFAFVSWASSAGISEGLMRAGGAGIDLSWAAVLVLAMLRAGKARGRRRELGIVLGPPASAASRDSGESDSTGRDSTGSDSTGSDSTGSDSTDSGSTGSDSAGSDSADNDSAGSDPAGGDSTQTGHRAR